MFTKLGINS